jgi:hypothetical protein
VGPRCQLQHYSRPFRDSLLRSLVVHPGLRTGYVKARPINQIMPWTSFREMADEDIAAIFGYIKTLKLVVHHVDNTEPPTYCKIDKQMHGGGIQN